MAKLKQKWNEMIGKSRYGPLVGAIDEGTSSTRFMVFAADTSEALTYHQIPVESIYPQEGWIEQDPLDIICKVIECINVSLDNLVKIDIDPSDICCVGITNQRETTVAWDSKTGKPLHNAIVWMDTRTTTTVDELLRKRNKGKDVLKPLCGLPLSTYFSAVKMRWMIDNVAGVSEAVAEGRCMFGTIDTWLIWNLTGGINGGLFLTDVTNASRTMLMNIETLKWDKILCRFFDIPMTCLAEIRSCSEIYGYLTESNLTGVRISGCLGDQQAALVGQMSFNRGQAKCTYGTGCFLLYNTGSQPIQSTHGLLTTVAYKLGKDKPKVYALEGSVAIAGVVIQWLRDQLGLIETFKECQVLAESVTTTGEVYFVPAFSGLYAPYWREDARSIICGLTDETKSAHIVRAALEAVCFQVRDILEAMSLDCGYPLVKLLVDGGMTANNLLMQLQADLCGIPVVRPLMAETTALGAAMAAGYADGVDVWKIDPAVPVNADEFNPTVSDDYRDVRYARWKMAIARCLDWKLNDDDDEVHESTIASIPASVFVITGAIICLISGLFRR